MKTAEARPRCRGGEGEAFTGRFEASPGLQAKPSPSPATDTPQVTMATTKLRLGGIFRGYFNRKRVRRKAMFHLPSFKFMWWNFCNMFLSSNNKVANRHALLTDPV